MHKNIYTIGQKLPKHDKLGIHATIESSTVSLLMLAIQSAFTSRQAKQVHLETARVRAEILKHLIRTEYELEIIGEKTYLHLSSQLIEIEKMLNGWISYISKTQKEPL